MLLRAFIHILMILHFNILNTFYIICNLNIKKLYSLINRFSYFKKNLRLTLINIFCKTIIKN